MSLTLLLDVIAYSIQLGALVLVASLITRLVGLRTPRPSLRFWQAVLLTALAIPVLQPGARESTER